MRSPRGQPATLRLRRFSTLICQVEQGPQLGVRTHARHALSHFSPRCTRQPLGCDPEAVLLKAGLEARAVAAFLHENLLEFIDDDGMRSASDALDYLSNAGAPRIVGFVAPWDVLKPSSRRSLPA